VSVDTEAASAAAAGVAGVAQTLYGWTFAPSWTHALVTNPRLGQTRDRCTRRMFLGEVTGVRGANVGSREMTATAAVGPQCWAMRGVSVIGSRLKSTKLPELYRIVPADSLPRPPPPPVM